MNKSTKNNFVLIAGMIVLMIFPFFITQAQSGTDDSGDNTNNTTITLDNPLGDKINDLPSFIYAVLEVVFQIGAILSVLAIIYVGFLFVSARGDPEKLVTARRAFLYTIIGIAVLLGATLIASVIDSTVTDLSTGIE